MIQSLVKAIEVSGAPVRRRAGFIQLVLGKDIHFDTCALESYGCKRWQPIVADAMIVAATVEYADRTIRRPAGGRGRKLPLRIAVHDPKRWRESTLSDALYEALAFLTDDDWDFKFVQLSGHAPSPSQDALPLSSPAAKIIPYSNGMDSLAVAGIVRAQIGDELVLVRLGGGSASASSISAKKLPFIGVPYEVRTGRADETSARSRGFRFALLGAIAAYLADASVIVVPESGQGAIGPALVPVAHAAADYRNHPRFLRLMEIFVSILFNRSLVFEQPRLWNTKGETLREYIALNGAEDWAGTKSCWRNNRWSSVGRSYRQCGVCAACMLRRMSVHAADQQEAYGKYICDDLRPETLREGVHPRYKRFNKAFEEYACAGTLHMRDLAFMSNPSKQVERHHEAVMLAQALGMPVREAEARLESLLSRHKAEWDLFQGFLGERSFVSQWAQVN